MKPMNTNPQYTELTQALKTKVISAFSCGAAIVALASVGAVKDETSKVLLLLTSVGFSATSLAVGYKQSSQALESYTSYLLTNPSQPKLTGTPQLFNLESMSSQRDEFPNVFICGAPGSGKTSIAEYLGCLLKSDFRYAIHPHAKPSDFQGFDRVFGGGRNIGSPDDDSVNWEDIVNDNKSQPSVAQVLRAIHGLMNTRYQQYHQGFTDFPTIDVYIDELPAIASQLGKKYLGELLPSLIMECRKVGIRLWFLTQALQVRALGLEGISDLRAGATIIRLGKLALTEGKKLSPDIQAYLSSQQRPVLVDDIPASLPGWAEMRGLIASYSTQRNRLELTQRSDTGVQKLALPTAPEDPSLFTEWNLAAPNSQSVGTALTEAFSKPNTPELTRTILRRMREDCNPKSPQAHILVFKLARREDVSPSAIIREYWGFQGTTKAYQDGRELAEVLGLI